MTAVYVADNPCYFQQRRGTIRPTLYQVLVKLKSLRVIVVTAVVRGTWRLLYNEEPRYGYVLHVRKKKQRMLSTLICESRNNPLPTDLA